MRFARLPWGPGRAFATSGTGLLIAGRGCLVYNEAYETTGTAAGDVTYYDGESANGLVVTDYRLIAGESTSEQWVMNVMAFESGIYVSTTAGSVAGSATVWVDYDPVEWFALRRKALWLAMGAEAASLQAVAGG